MTILKDIAVSLSLANLFFLRVWQELIFAPPSEQFYLAAAAPQNLVAVILNVLLLGTFFFCLLTLYRRFPHENIHKLVSLLLLCSLAIPLNFFRLMLPGLSFARMVSFLGEYMFALLLLLFCSSFIYLALRWHRQFTSIVRVILLILFPFVFLTFSQALWKAAVYEPPKEPGNAPLLNSDDLPGERVLWLIFDELDQRMTFDDRPGFVDTPELDSLRSQSIYATKAYAPGEDTVVSMPALISGLPVAQAKPSAKDELILYLENNSQTIPWSKQDNVFSKAHALGFNTGLVGCYLPYSRVIGHTLTKSSWQPFGRVELNKKRGLADTMLNQFLAPFSFSYFNQRRHAIELHLALLEEAKRLAADPALGLILIHWSIPHYPWIYNSSTDNFTVFNYNMEKGYFDNLVLVDKTLAELRFAMEKAGTWENTHIIISSDHPWRMELFPAYDGKQKPFIPFLLRMAGQEHKVTYQHPFNTVISKNLILELLEDKISSPDEAIKWLKKHSSPLENR